MKVNRMFRNGLVLIFAAACLQGQSIMADVRLPNIIGPNMVLQQGMSVPIWGWAKAGEKVTVKFCGQEVSAVTDADGKWIARLTPLKAGGPFEMTIAGKTMHVLKNVLVGEVWLGSGQSNMSLPLSVCSNAAEETAQANYPKIRLFRVANASASNPRADVAGNWVECSPRTVGRFSAVADFFGRDIHRQLKVPVGLINSSIGGTEAEAWTPQEAFRGDEEVRQIMDKWQNEMSVYIDKMEKSQQELQLWKQAADKARSEKATMPPLPSAFNDPRAAIPGRLYNAMIRPLIPFAIRGVIWYQGEANVGVAKQYRKLFPALIKGWRTAWGEGDFPFLFVQLAAFTAASEEPVMTSGWAELREAQTMTLALPKTGMALAIDIGDAKNIHPKNKQEVGRRLALVARAIAYGEDLVYSGPIYKAMTVESNKVYISFDHVGGGLINHDGELKRFEIAGSDGRFVWAKARIDGQRVVVWSDAVSKPVAVRYAWATNPEGCNLYNSEGLPASSFRTADAVAMPLPRATHIYHCQRVEKGSVIDGSLNELAWDKAKSVGRFQVIERFHFSKFSTEAKLAYDTENLYIGFRCQEPEMGALVCKAVGRDSTVYDDDSVEIFLDTALDSTHYYQYVVNPNGVIFDTRNRWGSDWNGPCTVTTGREKDAWTVNLAIPWKSLGIEPPKKGDRMGLQLVRTHASAPYEVSQWASTQGPSNHKPTHFGMLVFE